MLDKPATSLVQEERSMFPKNFYDLKCQLMNLNRLACGLKIDLSKHLIKENILEIFLLNIPD